MKYIHTNPGNIDFDKYLVYLETIRDQLPEHIFAFASSRCYFDLESRSSLHDAWMETLTVRESASGKHEENRKLEIHLCLLGPYHDRRIHLRYTGVAQYSFITPSQYENPRYQHTAHGDLFTHEITLGREGLVVHELLFERDATLLIECSNLEHTEELIPNAD
jgi:hypothetical protein